MRLILTALCLLMSCPAKLLAEKPAAPPQRPAFSAKLTIGRALTTPFEGASAAPPPFAKNNYYVHPKVEFTDSDIEYVYADDAAPARELGAGEYGAPTMRYVAILNNKALERLKKRSQDLNEYLAISLDGQLRTIVSAADVFIDRRFEVHETVLGEERAAVAGRIKLPDASALAADLKDKNPDVRAGAVCLARFVKGRTALAESVFGQLSDGQARGCAIKYFARLFPDQQEKLPAKFYGGDLASAFKAELDSKSDDDRRGAGCLLTTITPSSPELNDLALALLVDADKDVAACAAYSASLHPSETNIAAVCRYLEQEPRDEILLWVGMVLAQGAKGQATCLAQGELRKRIMAIPPDKLQQLNPLHLIF